MSAPTDPQKPAPRRRYALVLLIVFPCLLLAIFFAMPRAKPCSSACVVFIGDSITSNWPALQPPNQISGLQVVNHGLPSDTTTNMVSRFQDDVVHLRPRVVVILGGINDIGRLPLPTIENNLAMMGRTAKELRIQVVLSTLTPAGESTTNQTDSSDLQAHNKIRALNDWIREFTNQEHLGLADYYSVLSDDRGFYSKSLTTDGVHPSAQGYKLMEPVLLDAIRAIQRHAN